MVWLAIAIALPTSFLAPRIIGILFGAEYAAAAPVLAIQIWASIFVFIGVAGGKWLLNENLQIYTTINTSIGAATNVVLNYYLIPLHGVTGAAVASLVSFAIAGYFGQALFGKTRGNFIRLTDSLFPVRMFSVKRNR
jgi:O-antigen/teichoic acid export membrane protein